MRRHSMSWTTLALATAFAIPTLFTISAATATTATTATTTDRSDKKAGESDDAVSKADQAKLKEHNKLRAEITRMKYPAAKSEVVAHLRGIKADDKKWFADALPDRVFGSADDVMSALGWQTSPPIEKGEKGRQVTARSKG